MPKYCMGNVFMEHRSKPALNHRQQQIMPAVAPPDTGWLTDPDSRLKTCPRIAQIHLELFTCYRTCASRARSRRLRHPWLTAQAVTSLFFTDGASIVTRFIFSNFFLSSKKFAASVDLYFLINRAILWYLFFFFALSLLCL